MSDPIEQLVARMQRLEEAAFREFASTYSVRLQRLFLRRGLSEADSESLAANCVTQVVLNIARFQPSGPRSFDLWVCALARRAQIDEWRQRPRAEPFVEEPAWPETPDWDSCPPDVAEALQDALAQLSETARTVVYLRAVEGLQFREIGERLQVAEGTLRVQYHRALERLKNGLQDQPAVRAWSNDSSQSVRGQLEDQQ